MLGHGTTGCDALTESISCTTPTWAGAWELMQYSVSGRKTVIQRSSSKNLIKSLHPSSGSSSALTVLAGCGIYSSVFLLPTISFLVRGGLSHTAKKRVHCRSGGPAMHYWYTYLLCDIYAALYGAPDWLSEYSAV